ncbi:hypothetical protein [Paracoccus onubensis]|uniref:hypothetical protein n=1 Tax=Paracoccus onubensis TaxID=1675788 RepID=UPI0015FF4180|nr:hypothetical protein [Paracoccus onubensis]
MRLRELEEQLDWDVDRHGATSHEIPLWVTLLALLPFEVSTLIARLSGKRGTGE